MANLEVYTVGVLMAPVTHLEIASMGISLDAVWRSRSRNGAIIWLG